MLKIWIVDRVNPSNTAVRGIVSRAGGLLLVLGAALLVPWQADAQINRAVDQPNAPRNDPAPNNTGGFRFGLDQTPPASRQSQSSAVDSSMMPVAEFHMARMVYQDGGARNRGRYGFRRGWWAIDYPEAELHFHGGVDRLTNVDMADDSHHIALDDPALFDHPWLFAQQVGQGYWEPSDEEAALLREYLLKGGFLVIDDFHGGEWPIMERAMRKVLPGYSIVTLDPSRDEVFHVLYDLDTLTQIPGERHVPCGSDRAYMDGPAQWSGIYDDAGRLMVAIDFNIDMGDAWEHADDPCYPEPMTALAYRFGINYLIYAMTH